VGGEKRGNQNPGIGVLKGKGVGIKGGGSGVVVSPGGSIEIGNGNPKPQRARDLLVGGKILSRGAKGTLQVMWGVFLVFVLCV